MQVHNDQGSVSALSSPLQTVERLVNELPANHRIALVQRKYYGLGYDDIAANLGISEETARRCVHESYRFLRNQLNGLQLM
jgi:DNA-directed RNA polymerase specialized sigma24 family protein